MTFARVNPSGWAKYEVLSSAHANQLDIDHSRALDGYAGGTWNPTDIIAINNSIAIDADGSAFTDAVAISGFGKGDGAGILGKGDGSTTTPVPDGQGVMGVGAAAGGVGVYGKGIGENPGVYGYCADYHGVYGIGGVGDAGVFGEGNASGGNGVRGQAYGGSYSGVYGTANASGGYGVRGNIAATYAGYGVCGEGRGTDYAGVYGVASESNVHGVKGIGMGDYGYGVVGLGQSSTSAPASGDTNANRAGVVGIGGASGGPGVYGHGKGATGNGVVGVGDDNCVGVLAQGGTNRAAIRLIPRTTPSTVENGDFYYNSSGFLAFYHGGAWHQLATV